MSAGLALADVMRRDPVRLAPGDPIRRAVSALAAAGQPAAAVLEGDGTLAGILTEKDCFRPVLHASYYQEWRGCVADHMTRDPVTIAAAEALVTAAEMFLDLPHRVLPVLEGGRLVGMLERGAVMAALAARG